MTKKKTLIALGLGQLLSLLITSTGFSSSELSRKGITAPTSQSFANYVLLAIVYGSILIHRKKALQMKWYFYRLLGIVDVEANFLVVKAYQYTSLTSVMLLDCWTLPSVILLTWMFLKTPQTYKVCWGGCLRYRSHYGCLFRCPCNLCNILHFGASEVNYKLTHSHTMSETLCYKTIFERCNRIRTDRKLPYDV